MKAKKKKKAGSKKSSNGKPIEQRRYEHEVARRRVFAERLEGKAENYNKHQKRRNKELAMWMGICFSQRARLQELISQEVTRQEELAAKHPELKKLGVKVPLPKLIAVEAIEFDSKAAVAPLTAKGLKAAKPKVKIKKKKAAKPCEEAASEAGGEE